MYHGSAIKCREAVEPFMGREYSKGDTLNTDQPDTLIGLGSILGTGQTCGVELLSSYTNPYTMPNSPNRFPKDVISRGGKKTSTTTSSMLTHVKRQTKSGFTADAFMNGLWRVLVLFVSEQPYPVNFFFRSICYHRCPSATARY